MKLMLPWPKKPTKISMIIFPDGTGPRERGLARGLASMHACCSSAQSMLSRVFLQAANYCTINMYICCELPY
jgi:hypothetical protein